MTTYFANQVIPPPPPASADEAEIDHLVRALYGLTDAEIPAMEGRK